jgi:hypothetical protein
MTNSSRDAVSDDLSRFVIDTLDGLNKFIIESSDAINKFAIENRHILFPLINSGIDTISHYLKEQNRIWYETQNQLYETNKRLMNSNYPYYYLPNYKK